MEDLDENGLVVGDDILGWLSAGQGSTVIPHVLVRMRIDDPAQKIHVKPCHVSTNKLTIEDKLSQTNLSFKDIETKIIYIFLVYLLCYRSVLKLFSESRSELFGKTIITPRKKPSALYEVMLV